MVNIKAAQAGRTHSPSVRSGFWRGIGVVVAATVITVTVMVPVAAAQGPTSVSNVSVAVTGPSDAAGALSEFTFNFTTSASGAMSQAGGSEWYAVFPSGTGLNGSGQVTDTTTGNVVGGIGTCATDTLCGTFYGGVKINAGDTLSVDATAQILPAAGTGYTIAVHTSSDTTPATSSNSFGVVPTQAVSAVSVAEVGPSDAAGALSEFTFSFKTSSTGALWQSDNSEWYAVFPSGTGLNGSGQVTDTTTGNVVGGIGTCATDTLCGTFYGGVKINAGDTLSVDATAQILPAAGTGYTIAVHTSSDSTPATSSNSFGVVPTQAVSAVSVAEVGPSDAAGALSEFTFSFKTSSTGALWQSDNSEWYAVFPSGTGLNGSGQVTDTTTGNVVGGIGTCATDTLCGTFYGGVKINAGDTLSVDATAQILPAAGTGYTIAVHTSSDSTPATSSNSFGVVPTQAVSAVSVAEVGPSDAAGALSEFTFSFKTSSTGALWQSDNSEWYAVFPSGTGLNGSGQVTDTTTGNVVGGIGTCATDTLCGTLYGGVKINAGDTLSVDATAQILPAAGTGYTIAVHTSSDTTPATSSNSFKVTAAQATSALTVSVSNDDAGADGVTYAVTFKTSSTGALWQSDNGEWYINLPSGTVVNGSGQVTDTTTGQVVGGIGTCATDTLCGTLYGGVKINAGDTLQVVATDITNTTTTGSQTLKVTTSSDTVAADGAYAIGQSASISGTVLDAASNPVDGAPVQACPADGGPCQLGTSGTGGAYTLVGEATGTYTVIAHPPPNAAGAESGPISVSTTIPNSVTGIDPQLVATVVMPSGTTLTSGGTTQEGNVPFVNWGNPITYNVTGCNGGFGEVSITAVNTSTGQLQTDNYPLIETPAGSGNYVAQIPPLAPLHGSMSMQYTIACPGHTSMLPDSGTTAGGTSVIIGGSGFTGASAVTFGGVKAGSFTVVSENYILATTPAGTGTAPVDVTVGGTTTTIGAFTYDGVTGISPASGAAAGGTTVTITGSGFTDVQGVMFGLLPATSFTVVSPTEIRATAPACLGTVAIQVTNSFGNTDPVSGSMFQCTGGPPGSSSLVEGTGPDAMYGYAQQIETYVASGQSGGWDGGTTTYCVPIDVGGIWNSASEILEAFSPLNVIAGTLATSGGLAAAGVLAADPITAVVFVPVGVLAWTLFWYEHGKKPNNGGNCGYIDPSGTVVNTSGSPVDGATVTLLQQQVPPTGPFSAVDPASGDIEPATNPETTGSSGTFDWDALAGTYEAQAASSSCYAPGHPSDPDVTTPSFTLPPPAVGLTLTLDCPGSSTTTPTVTGLSSSDGNSGGGEVVEIDGTGLTGASTVHFGNAAASGVTVLSDNALAAIAPAGSSTVDVTVTTPGGTSGTSSADQYTYVTPLSGSTVPSITKVAPDVGPTSGNTEVTLKGKNLSDATQILVGGQAATEVTDVSATEVEAIVPAASVAAGAVSVEALSPNGESKVTVKDVFKYEDFSAPPSVTKVSPASGSAHGGTKVTIKGTNLTGTVEVRFGTMAASGFKVNSSGTKITVDAPPGSAGTVDITITRPGGVSAVTLADRFQYT